VLMYTTYIYQPIFICFICSKLALMYMMDATSPKSYPPPMVRATFVVKQESITSRRRKKERLPYWLPGDLGTCNFFLYYSSKVLLDLGPVVPSSFNRTPFKRKTKERPTGPPAQGRSFLFCFRKEPPVSSLGSSFRVCHKIQYV
jgi:hypothetical protein